MHEVGSEGGANRIGMVIGTMTALGIIGLISIDVLVAVEHVFGV
jgi:hypothetical protein